MFSGFLPFYYTSFNLSLEMSDDPEILSLMISESAVQNASLYLFSSLSLSIPK